MPKENTHIFFAYDILSCLENKEIVKLVSPYINDYILGSITPDIFFYSKYPEVADISEHIHGKDGIPTNEIIFSCLDNAENPKDIAFLLGFVTHCALDIIMHPAIYYLTGNYYDKDPALMSRSRYNHSLFETGLDIKTGNRLRIHKLLKKSSMKGLMFRHIVSNRFKVEGSLLDKTLKKQLFLNMLFDSGMAHKIFKPAIKAGILGDTYILGLFYREAAHSWLNISDEYKIRDIITGEKKEVTLKGLFVDAFKKAQIMMNAVFGFYKRSYSMKELQEAVPGENLSTGKLGVSILDIAYTLHDDIV
jgi:hypothetical protein